MARPKVHQASHRLKRDIDPDGVIDVRVIDSYVAQMVSAATDVLKQRAGSFSDLELGTIAQMFAAMQHSHRSVRLLASKGWDDAVSVDSLAIARLQIESLYALCLILDKPAYAPVFVKNGWKKMYIRFLLEREECTDLPRFSNFLSQAIPYLEHLHANAGVTTEEKLTIEIDELHQPVPPGFTRAVIPQFPLPSKIIDLVDDPSRASVLKRLYPEYEYLCNFTHSSVEGWLLRTMLDGRSPYRNVTGVPWNGAKQVYEKHVGEPAVLYSFIGVAQACAELTTLYQCDVELSAKTIAAWNLLEEHTLLGQSLWTLRTKQLLGIL